MNALTRVDIPAEEAVAHPDLLWQIHDRTVDVAVLRGFMDPGVMAKRAIDESGFQVVRIQTNARRLNKSDYVETLYAAGVREYFVSIHAGNAETDRRIT
jgi:hypothetical protein